MTFKRKVLFAQAALLFVAICSISSVSIWSIYTKGQEDVSLFRNDQIDASKEKLRTSVEIISSMIEEVLLSRDSDKLQAKLDQIASIRYDDGEGYFWITTNDLPFPKMIMHSMRKQDAGMVLNDEKFNTLIEYPDKNLYQYLVEQCVSKGEGYADYKMHKPGIDGYIPKMAYAHMIPDTDFIIYTGVYMDQVDRSVAIKESVIEKQIYTTISVIIGLTVLLMLGALVAVNYFSGNIITIILQVKESLGELAKGKKTSKIEVSRQDEIMDMVSSLNELILKFDQYTDLSKAISIGKLSYDKMNFDQEDQLGSSLQEMHLNLTTVIDELKEVIISIGREGDLSAEIETEGKQYAWKEIGVTINEMTSAIRKPFLEMNSVVQKMANGNLSQRVDNEYHGDIYTVINNLNLSLDELSQLIYQINDLVAFIESVSEETALSGEEMKFASVEMGSAITEISNGANNQVGKIESSSQYIEQIMIFSSELGREIKTITEMANKGKKESEGGLSVIQKMSRSFDEVLKQSSDANSAFDGLQTNSLEINKVVTVISEIASQTNLLALNAAIEAAQAGDVGRGFAVVAEEIRNLAESSRQSVKEIESLVYGIQESTVNTSGLLREMTTGIKASEQATKEVSERFQYIDRSSGETAELSNRIMSSSIQLVDDAKRIVSNTESVIVIAEETASGAEELTASSQQFTSGMKGYFDKSKELHEKTLNLKQQLAEFVFRESDLK